MFNNKKIKELEERIIDLELAICRFPENWTGTRENTSIASKIKSADILAAVRALQHQASAKMTAADILKTLEPDLRKRLTALYKKWMNPELHSLSRQETHELQRYGLIWNEHA